MVLVGRSISVVEFVTLCVVVSVKMIDVDGFIAENEFSRHHQTVVAAREEHRSSADGVVAVTGRRRLRHHPESAVDAFLLTGQGLVGRQGRGSKSG